MIVLPQTTILGQTAPGVGITVYGNGWSFSNADEGITRYTRIRMGKGGTSGRDAITIFEGNNMIFDHVSVTWGHDETFSISWSCSNITIQNTIIGQGLETYSFGGLMQTDGGLLLFRNSYTDNKTRNTKVKGVNDSTNNIVYNWVSGGGYIAGDSTGQSYVNIIGNYFISGPSTSVTAFARGNANFHGYVLSNFCGSDKNSALDGSALGPVFRNYGSMIIMDAKYNYPAPAKILSAPDAVTLAIKSAGASLVRDGIATRLIAELQSCGKSGELISDQTASPMNGPGTIDAGTTLADTDGDGIHDSVEATLGTDPKVVDSMKINSGGYTNIETWTNSLVPATIKRREILPR